ncbi:MAG: hypothetical protein JNL45_01100 [Hyphomicrobium sp.]|jgi:hypothetical protein|nr:hypothetical protein [Hyphomicrobium sp.]
MINIEEMKSRILASLEEAGCDRLLPLLNTVIDPQGDQSEVVIYEKALRELLLGNQIELGLTSIPFGNQPLSKDEALSELGKLVQNYRFNETRNLWNDLRCSGPPYYQTPEPEAILTDRGLQASEALLDGRGFEWWHRPE